MGRGDGGEVGHLGGGGVRLETGEEKEPVPLRTASSTAASLTSPCPGDGEARGELAPKGLG